MLQMNSVVGVFPGSTIATPRLGAPRQCATGSAWWEMKGDREKNKKERGKRGERVWGEFFYEVILVITQNMVINV